MVRYKKKKWNKKKKGFSKRKLKNTNTLVLRGPRVVPDQMFVKMTYRDLFTQLESLGQFGTKIYRANSIFDPDQSGVGGQPLGRDQWSNFYSRYQVMGSKITVSCQPTVNHGGNSNIALAPTDTTTAINGVAQLMEQPYSKGCILPLASCKPVYLTQYMSTKAKFGYKDITQEDDLSSVQNGNPAEQWYWTLGTANFGTDQKSIDFNVKITYYVRLFDRTDLARS